MFRIIVNLSTKRDKTPRSPLLIYNPSPMADPVLIVANPYSGRKNNRARVEQLVTALNRLGMGSDIRWGWSAEDAKLEGVQCVVVAGGDGSVGHVVRSLGPDAPALAVLPLGNENLLAKHLGYHASVDALARAIARGRTRAMDLAFANDHPFTLMLSAGIDAEVVHRVTQWRAEAEGRLRRISHRNYIAPIFRTIARYRFPPVEVEAEGVTARGAMAMVVNAPRYARGIAFTPDAKDDDGMLDWVVFEKPGRWQVMRYFTAVLLGRHMKMSDVHHGRAARLTIRHTSATDSVPLQTDGDDCGVTPVDIRVKPRTIHVIDIAEDDKL